MKNTYRNIFAIIGLLLLCSCRTTNRFQNEASKLGLTFIDVNPVEARAIIATAGPFVTTHSAGCIDLSLFAAHSQLTEKEAMEYKYYTYVDEVFPCVVFCKYPYLQGNLILVEKNRGRSERYYLTKPSK